MKRQATEERGNCSKRQQLNPISYSKMLLQHDMIYTVCIETHIKEFLVENKITDLLTAIFKLSLLKHSKSYDILYELWMQINKN